MNIFDSPKDTIRTNSGLFVNIFEPEMDMICIEDIAHALASMPRFGGHLNRHYSVAQHSVNCAARVSEENKKAALMHDASEAYMLDMPTPIKSRLPDYKLYENNLMLLIGAKYGFDYPLNEEVKKADADMLHIEWENMVLVDNEDFVCMSHAEAKQAFLDAFKEIFKS